MTDYRGKYFEGASAGNPVAVSTQKGDKKTAFGSDRNNLYKSDDGVITLDDFEFPHPLSIRRAHSHLFSLVLGAIRTLPDGHLSTLNTSITASLARCDIRRLLSKSNDTTVLCTV